ncbi:uncharacterized protein LOC123702877 [Colias croceus]|uniref:uncharacterized protein LOC123702877 n=1 Tax=Colias crocea TaxID=72248 RepID=UPI001E280A6D|nr:uncharacterized protein LOC123702877 [Colias croceus]
MQTNACNVCGGSDMNLVDGFYYCVECGTQNQNIQESVVDSAAFIGLYTRNAKSKLQNVREKMNLGPEWCKWHAYNFIVAGLTDELIAVGAAPSVKQKVLWIWTRYMKFFKLKDNRPKSQFFGNDDDNQEACNEKADHDDNGKVDNVNEINDNVDNVNENNDNVDNVNENNDKDVDENNEELDENDVNDSDAEAYRSNDSEASDENDDDLESNDSGDGKYADRMERARFLIKHVTKAVIIAIFYVALNLDKSDIQLPHLLRYVRWRYVDFTTCTKYIPKDLDVKAIPRFSKFRISTTNLYKQHTIRRMGFALMKVLNLGLPVVPDFRKMADNYAKDLCVPDHFKELVFALMRQYPSKQAKKSIILPDYEAICLSYFVVAFKLCFGLDDEYEKKVSNVVDKMNDEKNLSKSYKFGSHCSNSGRMFSFKEWCEYMKLRKMIVAKHNLRMARLFKLDVNDYVLLEHLERIQIKPPSLASDIVKDMLNKIPLKTEMAVIPKEEFDLSFTPMSSYTDVILDYIQDPDLRLMLSEDFTQYSLEYAIKRLRLIENMDSKNIITGVSKHNKFINKNISGYFSAPPGDDIKMVYIRFCENKDDTSNLLREPNAKECHGDDETSKVEPEKDNDECTAVNNNTKNDTAITDYMNEHKDKSKLDDEITLILENDCRSVTFVDYPNACIYDDDNKDDVKEAIAMMSESFGSFKDDGNFFDYISSNCLQSPVTKSYEAPNSPESVDRKTMINELIRHVCTTHKISLPRKLQYCKVDRNTSEKNKPRKEKYIPADYRTGLHKRKCESLTFMMLQSYYNNIQEQKNDVEEDNQEQSWINESIQENVEEASNNAEFTSNAENETNTDMINSTADDCIVQENDDDHEMEQLLDSDEEESEEEFILPETAQLNDEDISKIDKAADRILEKEIARCGRPPKKKLKLTENDMKKANDKKAENEKLLHPSAWGVKNFSYWIRRYSILTQMQKTNDLHDTFNIELYQNLPKSFVYVLNECGSLIDSSPFRLYQKIEHLELQIVKKLKKKNKTPEIRKRKSRMSVKK